MLLRALPMGSISSLDLMTTQFGSGMLRMVLPLGGLHMAILRACSLLFPLPMSSTLSLSLVTTLTDYGIHSHVFLSSHNPIHTNFYAKPDEDGRVSDSAGSVLYWVPPNCHRGLHSPTLLTIPDLTSHVRSVSLDFENSAFGTSWTQIFMSAQP